MYKTNKTPVLDVNTASGAVASFDTLFSLPLASHKIALTATQSGSGTPSPDNVRTINGYSAIKMSATGKNLVDFNSHIMTTPQNGLTMSLTADGGIRVQGTPTASWARITDFISVFLPKNNFYTFSIASELTHRLYMDVTYDNGTTGLWIIDRPNTATTITPTENIISLRLLVASMSTSQSYDETIYPMIQLGATATEWAPNNGTYTTIQIGSTVYGGEYDARTGVLTVTHILFTITNVDSVGTQGGRYFFRKGMPASSYSISMTPTTLDNYKSETYYPALDHSAVGTFFVTSAGTSLHLTPTDQTLDTVAKMNAYLADNPAVCVIPLAESLRQTIQLPPCPIDTLEGVNNVWSDVGETSLSYNDLNIAKRGSFREVFKIPTY